MLKFLTSEILESQEIIFFYIKLLGAVLVLGLLSNVRHTIGTIFRYLNDKLIYDKPYNEVLKCLEALDNLIIERFSIYCMKNIEYNKDFIITSDFEHDMIKDISEDIISYLSANMVAILSMYMNTDILTHYIGDKVLIMVTDYSVKNKTPKK